MATKLRVLYVAYPLLPVSPDSCGGAEQMLYTVEREMLRRGHRTTVAACSGSRVTGQLLPTGPAAQTPDAYEIRERQQREIVFRFLAERQRSRAPFDLVHDESGSFFRHAGEVDAPVLATLHLPRSFYPEDALRHPAGNVSFNCVSRSQAQTFADVPGVIGSVGNGIRAGEFPLCTEKRDYLLWMGRICEEKGPHVAIEVARRAGLPLMIAGEVYPFRSHQDYFEREIRPHMEGGGNPPVNYVGRADRERKLELLQHARALLVTSLVEETSSLVSMEAMACGTPVLAFRRGALPEVISDGVTGFVVDEPEQMARAIERVSGIDAAACRGHVERNYSAEHMAEDYERFYEIVVQSRSIAKPLAA